MLLLFFFFFFFFAFFVVVVVVFCLFVCFLFCFFKHYRHGQTWFLIICFKYTSYVQSPPMVISGRNTSHPATATNKSPTRHSCQSVQCCFTFTETIRKIRDGEPRTATSTFTQLLNSVPWVQIQCCFTLTETVLRTIRDGEPRMATSTFTQLLSSEHARHS